MTVEPPDPLLGALAELAAPAPREARAALVRARCHAAITASRRRRPVAQALDGLLPLAVVVYAAIVLVEGLRVAGVL